MKAWSEMTVAEHADAAGVLFEKHCNDHANGMHKDLIEATAHATIALALSNTQEAAS